tara:strand:- start:66601 stop:66972 length:372 start_codon:yes stop_codon:yes gene_type:complete
MSSKSEAVELPAIPDKRYFTIGETSRLCKVKPHVLRYWEQEFSQLRPAKRTGNRRYYQRKDVELIRKIRELLYEQGFTISGARLKMTEAVKDIKREQETVFDVQKLLSDAIRELDDIAEVLEV